MGDLLTRSAAVIDGPCRYSLSRQWDDRLPMAAWLLCNPSTADAELDDPTCRRMAHFSRTHGCGGFTVVNVFPLRTAYPAELWPRLRAGELTRAMAATNHLAIDVARERSELLIVGFGPEPVRRDREGVATALIFFGSRSNAPLLCLGTSPEGWPLHPLARGKFAIPNDRRLQPWSMPK